MATAYKIRILQLEENGGGTDIQLVTNSERVYESEVADPDFLPVELSGIERSLEFDKGVFEYGQVSAVVDGLAADYFNSYTDMLNQPFVMIVENTTDSTVLFHGLIDKETVSYNPGTGHTHMQVWSWEFILDRVSAAVRTVYETQLFDDYKNSTGLAAGTPSIQIPRYVNGDDLSAIVGAGDVVVFDTDAGEHRGVVQSTAFDADDILVVIDGPPQTNILDATAVASGDITRYQLTGFTGAPVYDALIEISDSDLWGALNALKDQPEPSVTVQATLPVSGGSLFVEVGNGTKGGEVYDATGRLMQRSSYGLDADQVTVRIGLIISNAYATELAANGSTVTVKTIAVATAGTDVRILGGEMYGYIPADTNAPYPTDEVIEALFSLTNIGVLRFVADTFTYPGGFANVVPKWAEFPTNLIESLRLLQNSEYSLLRFTPTVDGSDLPRLTVEVIPRTNANTSDRPTDTDSEILEWVEAAADSTPAAVVVRPSLPYFAPESEGDNVETVGFYYDGIAAANPILSGLPAGPDVVEITVNVTPSYSGDIFTAEGKGYRNDTVLKAIARKFYEYYQGLPRPAQWSTNGLKSDLLGTFVTYNEGGFTRTVMITKQTINPTTGNTEFEGRIGTYTDAADEDPVARITGELVYIDDNENGVETISLSGLLSYDPEGGPLTYSWDIDAATGFSNLPVLNTPLTVASSPYTIKLTVTDQDANTDDVTVTVQVLDPTDAAPAEPDPDAAFTVLTTDIDASGNVRMSVTGDSRTRTVAGIRIESSPDDVTYTPVAGSEFDNPMTNELVYATLAEGATIYLRATLINDSDGTDGEQWTGTVSRAGGSGSSLTVDDLTVENSALFDLPTGECVDIDINSNDVAEFCEDQITFEQDFTVSGASSVLFDLDTGEEFEIKVNGVTTVHQYASFGVPTVAVGVGGQVYLGPTDVQGISSTAGYIQIYDDDGAGLTTVALDIFRIQGGAGKALSIVYDQPNLVNYIDTRLSNDFAIRVTGSTKMLFDVSAADIIISYDLVPNTDNTYDLGSSSKAFAEVHAHKIYVGTTGHLIENRSSRLTFDSITGTIIQFLGEQIEFEANNGLVNFNNPNNAGDVQFSFRTENDAAEITTMAQIIGSMTDDTDGSEAGKLRFYYMHNGSNLNRFEISGENPMQITAYSRFNGGSVLHNHYSRNSAGSTILAHQHISDVVSDTAGTDTSRVQWYLRSGGASYYALELTAHSKYMAPGVDNDLDLGSSSKRWKDVYVANDIHNPNMPTSDPADGKGTLWVDGSGFVKLGT